MALDEYRKKRDFRKTPEPAGSEVASRGGPLAFVVQKHDASRLHYDFRLELDGVLKSWAVPKGPSLDPTVRRLAVHVEDHPIEYGDFEGVIPEDEYGGGTVMLWDRGVWEPIGDPERMYSQGRLKFGLEGEKLRGKWTLVRIRGRDDDSDRNWLLIKEKDEQARPESEYRIDEARPESVATGRDLDEIAEDRDRVWHSDAGREDGAKPKKRARKRAAKRAAGGAGATADGGKPGARIADPGAITSARKARLPETIEPQLARLVDAVPAGNDWLHEIKFDGYRVLLRIDNGKVRINTRSGRDWTARFPTIHDAAAALPVEQAIVDAEAVVLDEDGISSFQALQNALGRSRGASEIVCYAFDLLYLDGHDLTRAPLIERKAALETLLGTDDRIRYSDHVLGNGRAFYDQACKLGLEGIISKRANAPYRRGRSADWLKIKCLMRQEFVVTGFTDPAGSRAGFGALLLGVYEDRRLIGAGRVGTGFTDKQLRELHDRLVRIERKTPPIEDPPAGAQASGIHWVQPTLVAEVAFTEWTHDGSIRHPSFQGLREDRDPKTVVRERPAALRDAVESGDTSEADARDASGADGAKRPRKRSTNRSAGRAADGADRAGKGRGAQRAAAAPAGDDAVFAGVKLSNPQRVLYPADGYNKLDIARYWESVVEHALPHLRDRPLTLLRCPSGIDNCFFQKHAGEGTPEAVARVQVETEPGADPYAMIDGPAALFSLVQLAVLEFHVWGARADRLDRPDRLIFDLDPDEGLPWKEVIEAATLVRDLLASFELTSFVKTTGGKGLHVVLPLERRAGWDEVKEFARVISEGFANAYPKKYTAKMTKEARRGRIYIDYLRNGWNATAIAPFSTRARPGAPVSVPIAWDELDSTKGPPGFDIRSVPERLATLGADPWDGFDDVRQALTRDLLKQVGLAH